MLDFIKSIPFRELEWTEIFYAAFGSFIGIFVPLWLDKLKAHKEEKAAQKKLLASLKRELDSVKQLIEDYRCPEHKYDIFVFSTFVWESIISAGLLPDMLSDKHINGELLMEIYSDLSLLEELHEEFCHAQEDDLKMIYQSIVQQRDEIYEKISKYQGLEASH